MKLDIRAAAHFRKLRGVLYIESTLLDRFCGTRRANCASARTRLSRSLFLVAGARVMGQLDSHFLMSAGFGCMAGGTGRRVRH